MTLTYAQEPDQSTLMQGDILARTPELESVLTDVHQYFLDEKFLHFMVITQSCDLQRRGKNECKAPYISLAVVRSFEDAIQKELERICNSSRTPALASKTFVSDTLKSKLSNSVTSLVNNNLQGYFFLKADAQSGVSIDSCAFLRVSIPLKTMHYKKLLEAKRMQLSDVFQAKLGWLIGDVYSRIGTPDFDKETVNTILDRVVSSYRWVEKKQFKKIQNLIKTGKISEDIEEIKSKLEDPAIKSKSRRALFNEAFDIAWPDDTVAKNRQEFVFKFKEEFSALLQESLSSDEFSEIRKSILERTLSEVIEQAWTPGAKEPKKQKFLGKLTTESSFKKALQD